jgi:exodeoxyribonuclease-3
VLSVLTVNIGAAVRERAEALLGWLGKRPEDVFVLTETSGGQGTAFLLERFRAAGFHVVERPTGLERGVALASRIPILGQFHDCLEEITLPGRVAAAIMDCEPSVIVLGVYVPSRDASFQKTEKKRKFIGSLAEALARLRPDMLDTIILGGDYNVIPRNHVPLHPGFLPFEFGLLETLARLGLVDAHEQLFPGQQSYSWIGRTGAGYRYDYFHVGRRLASRINACAYLHETRELRLTDHAAVSLSLDATPLQRLRTSEPVGSDSLSLF